MAERFLDVDDDQGGVGCGHFWTSYVCDGNRLCAHRKSRDRPARDRYRTKKAMAMESRPGLAHCKRCHSGMGHLERICSSGFHTSRRRARICLSRLRGEGCRRQQACAAGEGEGAVTEEALRVGPGASSGDAPSPPLVSAKPHSPAAGADPSLPLIVASGLHVWRRECEGGLRRFTPPQPSPRQRSARASSRRRSRACPSRAPAPCRRPAPRPEPSGRMRPSLWRRPERRRGSRRAAR